MNTRDQIVAILKEWLELTRLECQALQVGRWSELPKIQRGKLEWQRPLVQLAERFRLEAASDPAANLFHAALTRLLDLESRTSELIALRKREVREKILLLEQAFHDLRRVVLPAALMVRAA